MEIGIVGLGKMGSNMARRLIQAGHHITAYDQALGPRQQAEKAGAATVDALGDLPGALHPPRAVWVMVPAGDPTEQVIRRLSELLDPDDIVLDGGNSNYKDTVRRASLLQENGIHALDVGTSGGVWGLEEGYCMMVGGEHDVVERLRPVFEALAPAPDQGWGHVGPSGAGHFVKMIHNGIEYGLMQAYAEGFAILRDKSDFDLDLHQTADIWRHGSVIRSWLLDLTANALQEDADLPDIAPYVEDSGEGRWTVQEAIDLDVPAPVITHALIQRLQSRTEDSFADKLLAAMRQQFGGHAVKQA